MNTQANEQFQAWMALGGELPRLEKQLVHKSEEANVLLARTASLDDERLCFGVQFAFTNDHSFFFEHQVDHVPGLALIEAARQAGLAVAHQYYDVPLKGYAFFIHELHTAFHSFAGLNEPVFGVSRVTNTQFRKGVLKSMSYGGEIIQNDKLIAEVSGRWSITPQRVFDRMRRSLGRDQI